MRQATFSIRRVNQNGSTFYSIYVPAYLSPTGKKAYQYFRTKADVERRRGELLAATRTESKLTELSNAQVRDAQRALERIAEGGLDLTLDKAIELALPSLKAAGRILSTIGPDELSAWYEVTFASSGYRAAATPRDAERYWAILPS